MEFKTFKERLIVDIDTKQLRPDQVRQLKTLNTLIQHIMTTSEEDEFFEASREIMQRMVSLMKQSNFASNLKEGDIPYAEQAVEYSLDAVSEALLKKQVHLDN